MKASDVFEGLGEFAWKKRGDIWRLHPPGCRISIITLLPDGEAWRWEIFGGDKCVDGPEGGKPFVGSLEQAQAAAIEHAIRACVLEWRESWKDPEAIARAPTTQPAPALVWTPAYREVPQGPQPVTNPADVSRRLRVVEYQRQDTRAELVAAAGSSSTRHVEDLVAELEQLVVLSTELSFVARTFCSTEGEDAAFEVCDDEGPCETTEVPPVTPCAYEELVVVAPGEVEWRWVGLAS